MSLKKTLLKKASQGILIASGVWFGIRNHDMFEEIKKQTLAEYRPKTKEELNIYSIESFITNNIYYRK